MTTFIAICRGNTIDDARILAISTAPELIREFAMRLAGINKEDEKKPRKKSANS